MKVIFALALLIAVAFAAHTEKEYRDAFTSWMRQSSKSYGAREFHTRYQIFKKNLDFVEAHNAKKSTYKVAMNKFGDLSGAEFKKVFNGLRVPADYVHETTGPLPKVRLPATFDWRTQGAVTGVKNQAQCGSCWSFSTTGSVEGCHKLGSAGTLPSLSEQNIMDCSWNNGNQGCNGGLMTSAMDYIISNGGVDTEASYPYTAESSQTCNYNAANSGSTLASYYNIASGDENDLQNSVAKGPTSVAIDASQDSFQFYTSGVYNEPACSSSQLDHGVLAVGWGSDSGTDYWIVKNSWGTDWGQAGYIWMSRNANNQCGIATMATLPQTCS